MVADSLNNNSCAGVSYAKSFTCNAVDICLAGGCAVKRDVADYDVFICLEGNTFRRIYNNFTAGKTFADVVVAVALKLKSQTVRYERAEALTAGTFANYAVCVVFQFALAVFFGDF